MAKVNGFLDKKFGSPSPAGEGEPKGHGQKRQISGLAARMFASMKAA